MNNIGIYIIGLLVIIIGFLIVKKITTCMLKAVVGIIVLAIIAGLYFYMTA